MFLLAPAIQTLCLVIELRVHVSHDKRLLVHHILDFLHLLGSLVVRRSGILDILFSLVVPRSGLLDILFSLVVRRSGLLDILFSLVVPRSIRLHLTFSRRHLMLSSLVVRPGRHPSHSTACPRWGYHLNFHTGCLLSNRWGCLLSTRWGRLLSTRWGCYLQVILYT